ncbi:50S ribosomal protein L25/general stress protein Ctc [Sinomicrobium kalidii]|uniref:50S ribosomal protein L25/general stress protein Ctc n=1 Tax=Sinomicrobium kalidii TaxID=2900738 RepID=UPI001E4F047F|nr:50S ribosomal protein L25/general stress protein Ctc [Sinomicrobium kalidii]UGU18318.1 50S ribosomal protein L25/general stress protein Ctc [Sinomicrobium kalidii]
MKSITIKGSQRESVGKVATRALRNAGKVPCVLYGGDKPLHFSADELAFSKLVYTPDVHTVVIDLENGEKFNAIMQDIQFHPVTDEILHIDFYQLHDDKEVTLEIPVKIEGDAPGVIKGGVLRLTKRKLKVRALPAKLPDYIVADISGLEIGNKLYVTALGNDDYKILNPDNTVVCQVRVSRAAMKAAQDAAKVEKGETPAEDK